MPKQLGYMKKAGTKTSEKEPRLKLTAWGRTYDLTRVYALVCVGVLGLTTWFWALLSSRLQQSNADQLVNSYLFEHLKTFQQATFPESHSFLLKWPLFYLIRLFGTTTFMFSLVTIGLALLTVLGFAVLLWRIERRLLIFGTICLALALVLLMVPPLAYPGGLLPTGLAMITTRNVEYLMYILSLLLLARSRRWLSWTALSATSLLSLLIASDKLFMSLSIGGAALASLVYLAFRRWNKARLAGGWLLMSLLSSVLAMIILHLISRLHLTHFAGHAAGASPYGLSHGAKNFVLGGIYAVAGLFTNFGANPVFDVTTVARLPHQLLSRFISFGSIAYLMNTGLLLVGLFAAWRVWLGSLQKTKTKPADDFSLLANMLIYSSLAAAIVFVASNHYYAVDARYLAISGFALFVAAAVYLRQKTFKKSKIWLQLGGGLCVGILIAIGWSVRAQDSNQQALTSIDDRNRLVAQVLAQHKTDTLAGDYWRVLPIRLASRNSVQVLPLSNCTQPAGALSSKAWQPDLNTHHFAYLLSFDKGLTTYPSCSLDQIIKSYGRPNASFLIAGNPDHPKESLLFYDRGAHKSAPKIRTTIPSTVLPIPLTLLPNTACPDSSTLLTVVAHQDDDLLFMNPDLQKAISAGKCVRTIYLTAGDAGAGQVYWLGREQGAEAAYSAMLGTNTIWVQRIVHIADDEFITVANPRGDTKTSLIFLRLPDGNLRGQGFRAAGFQSLTRLRSGKVKTLHSVDSQSAYTADQLVAVLTNLMLAYRPAAIHTQATYSLNNTYPDHGDHLATGHFARDAYLQYVDHASTPLSFYAGYPIRARAQNVVGEDLDKKITAWLAYAKFDGGVCQSIQQCNHTPTYFAYLRRQYTVAPK
ncbi:MAG: hypothetical protein JWS12_949 [Candidatus Saccharibacteria bacterium]|nr:hypothetical protein [Candidatus Saccharibacteria bacterium]